MPHIAILVHAHDRFDYIGYFLREIARIWREQGFQISVLQGPASQTAADLAILHVDLTVIPGDYLVAARRFPRLLNGAVLDISKRKISCNILSRTDNYDGPVIVKTNRNSGGWREARLMRTTVLRRAVRSLRRRLPWACRAELKAGNYPIFESMAKVPRLVWHNPNLVVERFLSEQRDGFYCLRTWVFFGDRETNSLSYSKDPIVKSSSVIRREPVAEVPDELRRMRRDLGFDFGKFDYAIVDGRVVLYDANRTPALGHFSPEQYEPRARLLAEGIRAFL
jgi:hypothetical protein